MDIRRLGKSYITMFIMLTIVCFFVSCGDKNVDVPVVTADDNDFDYISDISGTSSYADKVGQVSTVISQLKNDYFEFEIGYTAVVIPAKYQLYGDSIPDGMQKSGMTVAESLCVRLGEDGSTSFIDMDAPLHADNTAYDGDSLGSNGGYIIYHTAVNSISELSEAQTDCEEIAASDAGKNYETVQDDDTAFITELTDFERVKRTSTPCLAVIGSDKLTKVCMPFFSSAFKRVCYFESAPDGLLLEKLGVKYVLYLIDTEAIVELCDKRADDSAEAEAQEPTLRIIKQIDSKDSLTGVEYKLLCGECTPQSTITISGSNIETVEQFCGRSRFFIPLKFKRNKSCSVNITSTDKNGEVSSIDVSCTKIENFQMNSFSLGKNNFVHWPDMTEYLCNNYNSTRGMQTIYKSLNKRFENIKAAAGDDTKFFILLMPDPLVMYDDSASDELAAIRISAIQQYNTARGDNVDPQAEIYTNMSKTVDYINEQNPEFTIIDMTPVLKKLKSEETYPRLYHTTDNHWSSLGAYYGYREIMNFVYESSGIEATKPLELSDFDIVDYNLSYTNQLGISDPRSEDIYEVVDLLVPHTQRVAKLTSGTIANDGRFWSDVQNFMSFTTGKTELPDAVFLRDSFTTALYPMLNEHFNNTYYSNTWDYSLDYDWLAEVNPDYVFLIAVERLIGSALAQR